MAVCIIGEAGIFIIFQIRVEKCLPAFFQHMLCSKKAGGNNLPYGSLFLQAFQLLNHLLRIEALKHVVAADESVDTGLDQSWRGLVVHASVHFDFPGKAHGPELGDLLKLGGGQRLAMAMLRAAHTSCAGMLGAIAQPTTLRENKSSTAAKYSQPLRVR